MVTAHDVQAANRAVYNAKSPEDYDRNESIFGAGQRARIAAVLRQLRTATGGRRFLDVGCGTGNLLSIAAAVFPWTAGADLAEGLLVKAARGKGLARLVAAEAGLLPFAAGSFDVVGMYALLHHVFDPLPVLAEAYRVLRPGGMLFTDHDPNGFFARAYRLWYRRLCRTPGRYWSPEEAVAEYHQTQSDGLDAEALRRALTGMGFRSAEVRYRHSENPQLRGWRRLGAQGLRLASAIVPARCFYTHFMLVAAK